MTIKRRPVVQQQQHSGMIHNEQEHFSASPSPPPPDNDDDPRDGIRMWKINTDASAVVAAAITHRRDEDDDHDMDDDVIIDREGRGVPNRGLFRKFSLKVIEWIRKSLELGRNEVCEVCLCARKLSPSSICCLHVVCKEAAGYQVS